MAQHEKKVYLLMAIHCHQPASNFESVFEEAYAKAYLPFLDVFEEFSHIKLSFHFSGSLLDWIAKNHPEFIQRLKFLLDERRIELLGGGYFEPILSLVPECDAVGQIKLFQQRAKELFGFQCQGLWLTERIWEPKLPRIIAEAGLRYTIIDDYHFSAVGMDVEKLHSCYVTEEDLKSVIVFPGSERLRYALPFKLPEETIDYLRQRLDYASSDIAVSFADDGEKFGLWPGTHKWVYREKWLKAFLSSLEANKDWISTATFSEYLEHAPQREHVYLPCVAYREMQQWSGGFFRNFLVRYPEANAMHKRMFFVSEKLNKYELGLPAQAEQLSTIKHHLYRSQTQDAYWHGIYGGVYLHHLRSGIYEEVIKAENALEQLEKSVHKVERLDCDCDGNEEVIVTTKRMRLCFRPEEGATISGWDDRVRCINIANTVARRPELYHDQLMDKVPTMSAQGIEVKENKNLRPVKDKRLNQFLFYDRYPRYSLRDYLLDPQTTVQGFYKNNYQEIATFSSAAYDIKGISEHKNITIQLLRKEIINKCIVRLTKTVNVADDEVSVDYFLENFGVEDLRFIFGTEFNFSVFDKDFSTAVSDRRNVVRCALLDAWKKVKIDFTLKPKGTLWSYPVEAISDSEQGIEKNYQELCLFFNWPVELKQNSHLQFSLSAKIG